MAFKAKRSVIRECLRDCFCVCYAACYTTIIKISNEGVNITRILFNPFAELAETRTSSKQQWSCCDSAWWPNPLSRHFVSFSSANGDPSPSPPNVSESVWHFWERNMRIFEVKDKYILFSEIIQVNYSLMKPVCTHHIDLATGCNLILHAQTAT